MVVVALMGLATATVGLALRDSAEGALEKDAQRLAAVLEATRAQARASGARALWQAQDKGFVVQGLPTPAALQRWQSEQTRAQADAPVVLGPEPLIGPQRIALFNAERPEWRLWVATDGLRPFQVLHTPPPTTAGTPP
jgi:general secretion pathway protein H